MAESIFLTPSGIVTLVSDVQPSNALFPIEVHVESLAKAIFFNETQPEKASFPIVVIVFGNVLEVVTSTIFVNAVQPLNALFPIEVHVEYLAKVIFSNETQPEKASFPIEVHVEYLAKAIFSNETQPEKASFPIVVIVFGNVLEVVTFTIFVNAVQPLNALFPMDIHFAPEAKVTFVNAVHPSNAEASIPVIVLAIDTAVIDVCKLLNSLFNEEFFHASVTFPEPVIFKVVFERVYVTLLPLLVSVYAAYILDDFKPIEIIPAITITARIIGIMNLNLILLRFIPLSPFSFFKYLHNMCISSIIIVTSFLFFNILNFDKFCTISTYLRKLNL